MSIVCEFSSITRRRKSGAVLCRQPNSILWSSLNVDYSVMDSFSGFVTGNFRTNGMLFGMTPKICINESMSNCFRNSAASKLRTANKSVLLPTYLYAGRDNRIMPAKTRGGVWIFLPAPGANLSAGC